MSNYPFFLVRRQFQPVSLVESLLLQFYNWTMEKSIPLRLLFINAIDPYDEIQTRQPALGLAYLVSSIRKHFSKPSIDFKLINKDLEANLKSYLPQILFISSVTLNFKRAVEYVNLAHQNHIPVFIGGIHITMLPNTLPHNCTAAVLGEGEQTVLELIQLFLDHQTFPSESLRQIKGLAFRDKGKIIQTSPREVIKDLDTIPFPARDLLKIAHHTYLFTSRGCPYKCVFCASTKFWPKVRYFSAEYVFREILDVVEQYNVKIISFYDDLFIGSLKRLEKIVSLVKAEPKLRNIVFTGNARANLVSDKVVRLLKDMNFKSINLGFESGCEKSLHYLKGNVQVRQNLEAIHIIKKHKLACQGTFIIGSPQETRSDILETFEFIRNSPINLFDIYILTPYPGTEVWAYAKKRNLVSDHMDWRLLNQNLMDNPDKMICLSEVLSKPELLDLYKKFLRLRVKKNLLGLLTHPYKTILPVMAWRLLKEKLYKKSR